MDTIDAIDAIAELREEARTAGDYANVVMCRIALGEELTPDELERLEWLDQLEPNIAAHVRGLTVETAWQEAVAQLRDVAESD